MTCVTLPVAVSDPGGLPCSCYTGRSPCRGAAVWWLYAPDGEKNPGGYVCDTHGRSIVGEFAAKLGETWHLVPIVRTRHLPPGTYPAADRPADFEADAEVYACPDGPWCPDPACGAEFLRRLNVNPG